MSAFSDQELLDMLKERLLANKSMPTLSMDEKRDELDKVKSQFLSDIRNDINNPLAAIIGLSQSISSNEELPREKIKQFADAILFDAQNLDFHLENIVLSAEFEAGRVYPIVKSETLIKLFEIELAKVQYLTKKTGHTLKVNYDQIKTDQRFNTDKQLFSMLIRNLLINAMRYSDPSEIHISIVERWDFLIVSIKDQGEGFGEEELKGVFNRFNRLGAPKNGFSTSSVCMSLIKSICEILSYDVQLDSIPGEGTTYSLVIDNTKTEITPDVNVDDFDTDDFDLF